MADALDHARVYIQDASLPVARAFGLVKLPENAHFILASALFFWAVHYVGAPVLSKLIAPKSYAKLKGRKKVNDWNIRVVSLVHALIILPLAFQCLSLSALDADRAFGWDPQVGVTASIACGYFIWDTLESSIHFSDIGFVIHGLTCFFIYFLVFRPFIPYYGPRFLLWELSTPFLNIHWFLDKMDLTGSTYQFINGIFLLVAFAGTRLVYGIIQSYAFYQTLYTFKDQIPLPLILVYGFGNVVLNGLNFFWFTKMITSVTKRIAPSKEAEAVKSR